MRLRRQLPAYSPLPLRAITAGLAGWLGGGQGSGDEVMALIREEIGARAVVLVDSGTSALTLALRAVARRHPGEPVALPAYCCYDVATAADGAGVGVLLYDLDPATLGPAPGSLELVLKLGARAVVVAHLYGIPVDLGPLMALAREAGAIVIEDAAQGAGAWLDECPLGALGDLAILSFGRGKGRTAGRGGALLASIAPWHGLVAGLAGQLGSRTGWSEPAALAAQWFLGRPELFALPASLPGLGIGESTYRKPAPLRGLSRFAAAVLGVTWSLAEEEGDTRRDHAARLLAALPPGGAWRPVTVPPGSRPGYLRLPLLASGPVTGLDDESGRLGIMPGYPRALCDLRGFAERCLNPRDAFPGARRLAACLCTAPTHGRLTDADLGRLERWLGVTTPGRGAHSLA